MKWNLWNERKARELLRDVMPGYSVEEIAAARELSDVVDLIQLKSPQEYGLETR